MTVICSEHIFNLVNNPEKLLLCMGCMTMFFHDCIIDSLTVKEHNTGQGAAAGERSSIIYSGSCVFCFLFPMKPK